MAVIAAIGAQQIGADRAGKARTIELDRDEGAGLAVVVPARPDLGTNAFRHAVVGEMDALRYILGTSGPDDLVGVNTAEPELVLGLLQEMFPGARAQA